MLAALDRHSEERYRAIVETATDYAILTTDAKGRIETWARGAEEVFGWAAEGRGASRIRRRTTSRTSQTWSAEGGLRAGRRNISEAHWSEGHAGTSDAPGPSEPDH